MNRCQYAAIYFSRGRNKFGLLVDVINLETGELFRGHCWIKKGKLFKTILSKKIIRFSAKEERYRKKSIERLSNVDVSRLIPQRQLVRISNIEVIGDYNGDKR